MHKALSIYRFTCFRPDRWLRECEELVHHHVILTEFQRDFLCWSFLGVDAFFETDAVSQRIQVIGWLKQGDIRVSPFGGNCATRSLLEFLMNVWIVSTKPKSGTILGRIRCHRALNDQRSASDCWLNTPSLREFIRLNMFIHLVRPDLLGGIRFLGSDTAPPSLGRVPKNLELLLPFLKSLSFRF